MILICILMAIFLEQEGPAREKKLTEWIAAYQTATEQERKLEIVAAVARFGKEGAAFLETIGLGPPSPIRDRAIVSLGEMTPPALGSLAKIAQDGPKGARTRSLETLANLGEGALPVAPHLISLLNHPEPQTRLYTIRMLGNCGPKAFMAIPPLLEMLRFGDKEEYPEAHRALLKLSKSAFTPTMDIVPGMMRNYLEDVRDPKVGLEELIKSKSPSLRREAIRQVAQLGPKGRVAMPVLQNLLQDKDPAVMQEAFDAIQKLK